MRRIRSRDTAVGREHEREAQGGRPTGAHRQQQKAQERQRREARMLDLSANAANAEHYTDLVGWFDTVRQHPLFEEATKIQPQPISASLEGLSAFISPFDPGHFAESLRVKKKYICGFNLQRLNPLYAACHGYRYEKLALQSCEAEHAANLGAWKSFDRRMTHRVDFPLMLVGVLWCSLSFIDVFMFCV